MTVAFPSGTDRQHPMRWPLWLVIAVAAAGASAGRAAQSPPSAKLYVAGNDQVLWLVVGQWNVQDEAFYHSFAVMEKTAAQVRPVTRIAPQKGSIERLAVVGRDLHVFFARDAHFSEDGAHYHYDQNGGTRDLSLPGPVMPAAVAGESWGDRPRLWAVVSAATAAAVRADREQAQKEATQPANPGQDARAPASAGAAIASKPASSPGSVPPEQCHLVQYDGVNWRPGFAAPAGCGPGDRIWLSAGENRFYLLWQARSTPPLVRYAWYEKDGWVIGPPVPLDEPPVDAFAGVINARLIFAAIGSARGDSRKLRVSAWAWQPGGAGGRVDGGGLWSRLPGLQLEAGKELTLPADAVSGSFADKLVLLRGGGRPPEYAFFSPLAGGPPDRPFTEVPLAGGGGISRSQRNLRDLVATMVVAALLLLVFWRRQESIATTIPLPAGVAVAGPGKRAAAALVDMVPAAVVAGAIWFDALRQFLAETQAAIAAGQGDQVETPQAVIWAWLCFVVIYITWCIVFEVLWLTTPGKRLLGCEVRLENFEKPNAVQIVIRNITKFVELMPYLQIWPFLLVVFFTRNHQRVGDLLAHTLVVEHHQVVSSGDFNDQS